MKSGMSILDDVKLTSFKDFEHIMIHLAAERGWQFKFAGEHVPAQNVFNRATYAPALLTAAKAELAARGVACDLGIRLEGEPNSLFGARVDFEDQVNGVYPQLWRLATAAMIVESLPKVGQYVELDPLQFVLGDSFASYLAPAISAPQGAE
jgi:hypothetical protein